MDPTVASQLAGAIGTATTGQSTPEFDALPAAERAEATASARSLVAKLGILADRIDRATRNGQS
jgi:hypothetical protein